MGEKTILIIPHVRPDRNLRIRSVEMAKCLANEYGHRVFILDWSENPKSSTNRMLKTYRHAAHAASSIRNEKVCVEEDGVIFVQLPHILRPRSLGAEFNAKVLEKFVYKECVDLVINANAHNFKLSGRVLQNVMYIYDLVDDFLSPDPNRPWKRTRPFVLRELCKSDRIITISHQLHDLLVEEGFVGSLIVPNGVAHREYIKSENDIDVIRRKFNIIDNYLVAYIGNHIGWFANTGFLVRAFIRFHKKYPDARLLIVGPVNEDDKKNYFGANGVIFTGSIPSRNIVPFYKAADLGVLPFRSSPFTNNALPMKILEYGAARIRVIASPLRELERLCFPHVSLCPLDEKKWVKALEHEYTVRPQWQKSHDLFIENYDWVNVVAPISEMICGNTK